MRVLVYPHDLGIGGSQLNAIELAAAVRDLGHDAFVFGRSGALNSRIDQLGLEFVEAPPAGKRPSFSTAEALRRLVSERGVDVIHGYEWPPVLDGVLAMARGHEAAVVATVMSMSVPSFIPRSVPLVVGTAEIAAAERSAGRVRTEILEPPVDLAFNSPAATPDVEGFRSSFGIDDSRINIVSVARFARELKLEGILTAIDVIGELSASLPVRLVLVGDGPAREEVQARADSINARVGAGTIVLTGQIDDPRRAYASADISLGMGGSALRALAYGVPLVVQGEHGFWKTLRPETVEQFLWTGWYGVGDGIEQGGSMLRTELQPLLESQALRNALGGYGRRVVHERFSLTRAASIQLEIYQKAIARPARMASLLELRALGGYGRYYIRKRLRRALGTEAADDFNSRPVAAVNKREGGR